jgi:hypothetical protein
VTVCTKPSSTPTNASAAQSAQPLGLAHPKPFSASTKTTQTLSSFNYVTVAATVSPNVSAKQLNSKKPPKTGQRWLNLLLGTN